MRNIFNRLVPDMSTVFARFPLTIAISIFAFCFFALETEKVFSLNSKLEERIYFSLFVMFMSSGGAYLLAEGRGLSKPNASLVALIIAAVIGALGFYTTWFSVSFLMLILALFLWLMIAGFLRSGVSFNAVWLFNSRLALAIILAWIVGSLFFAGTAAILASLEYLFNIKMSSNIYSHAVNAAVTLVGALYGLSLIPDDINEELQLPRGNDLLNRGISILINYIMVPVLLVYVVILHAYAAKILFTSVLPKGQVGTMVLLFGIGGTATWLIARPWVETGTKLLRIFTRFWFWFTIIPTLMLCLAVYVRINQYGVTPERYGLVLVAIWLLAMIGYFAVRRIDAKPQIIIGSMAAMLFVGSFGPWGAQEFSVSSQLSRFETYLAKWSLINNGKLVNEIPDNIPKSERKQAASIVKFLRQQKRLSELKVYFKGETNDPFKVSNSAYKTAKLINGRLKLDKEGQDGAVAIFFNTNKSASFNVPANHRLIGPFDVSSSKKVVENNQTGDITVILKNHRLMVKHNSRSWAISQHELLVKASKAQKTKRVPQKFKLAGPGEVFLIATDIRGELGGKSEKVSWLQGWLLLPAKP